ncbi:MAG: PKD domain-containing protein [Saprospiraceae bacterium]
MRKLLILMAWMGLFLSENMAQVNADFSANITEGCGTLAVSFSDLSTSTNGTITNWSWALGGVAVSTQQAGRIFPEGFYEICLTVTDDNGNSDTECKIDYIKVFKIPTADFTADITAGCAPLEVVFEDLSSSSDGAITQWIWGVGGSEGVIVNDGSMTSIENLYNISDSYDISLTITNENGCVETVTKDNFIEVSPAADIQVSSDEQFQCTPPFNVNFINQNVEQNIEYTWNFGNGANFVGANPPTVSYQNPGTYDVTIVGVDAITGCSETLVLEDYISVGYPIDFTFDQTEICAGTPVNFQDISGSSADNVIWDFGDGGISDDPNPTYTFETPGCFTVTLTRFENGCETTIPSNVCIQVNDVPSASFTVTNSMGCSLPHVSSFTSTTQNATSWLWEFGENGEAGISSNPNPSVTFTEYGSYPIYLTVSDALGCSNTILVDTIEIIEVNAAISDDHIAGCSPFTFSLQDATTSAFPITEWYWEIETPSGVFTSTDANPSFTISDTGCFDIVLAVVNELGCLDTSIITNKVCVGMKPVVAFEANPTAACLNENIYFTNLSSSFADEWFWSFGDSLHSFLENPEHEYVDTGFFDVTLEVFHNGCGSELEIENFIQMLAPRAMFNFERDCSDPYDIQFVNTSIGAEIITWDFGDLTTMNDTSTMEMVSYTYPDTGEYLITLTTYNSATGCGDTTELSYYITDPKAEFSLDTTQGCAPLTLLVDNNSEFGNTYSWTSGDATFSSSSSSNPEITFGTPGTYDDLQLIITDINGCPDTVSFDGEIIVNGVTVDFEATPPIGCNPLEVDFFENSSSLYGNVLSWDWNIGNGYLTSDLQNPSFTFDSVGTYPVTLTVTDDWNCQNSLEIPDGVIVTKPFAKFKGDTMGCTISTIKFLNQSHGTGLTYEWTFGDGEISIDKNPTHEYLSEGTFTVCLTVTDVNGCTDSYCLDDYVVIANPVANFTSDISSASCPPLIVNFENLSQNASSYEWNFGNGSGSSNLENPPHVYTVPGEFDVTLIAISSGVCRDTLTLESFIELDGPEGSFTFEMDNPCIPTEVYFYAESNEFYNYIWDYGDGTLDTSGYKMTDTVSHYYTQNYDFVPTLILIDDEGCIRPIAPPDTIALVALDADFTASQTKLCNNNPPITFINLSNSSNPVIGVEWFFEGGSPAISTDLEPQITYSTPGVFDVMMIVDNGSCKDTLVKTDYISVGEVPVADFARSSEEGCAPLAVTFTDGSTISTGFIEKWDWVFSAASPAPTSNLQNPSHTYLYGENAPVQLRVTSNEGCVDSILKMVNVFPIIELEASGGSTICQGEEVNLLAAILSDTTGVSYYWENDPTLSCTDCLNPIVNPVDTTTYTFVAVSAENCMFSASVTVNVRDEAIPIVSISNDTTICANDVTQIFATGGDNITGYDWDQSAAGLTCYNACNNPIASPALNTTYTVTVTNTSGCSSTASTTVSVFYEFQNLLGDDRTICKGDTAHLQVLQGNNPFWISSDGLSCSSCPNPVASPTETSTYIVRVDSDFGCEIFDTITVNILSPEDIDAGDDMAICIGSSAQLTGFGEGIPSWTPAATLNQTDIFNPIATPTEATTYYFSLENGDCILTDSMVVEIIEKTEIDLLDQSICLGEALIMQPIGFADTYLWSPPEGLSSIDIENPTASPTETTEYTVIAQSGTCPPDTASAIVEVLDNPTLNVAQLYRYFPGDPIELNVATLEAGDFAYQWTPGIGLSCTDCPNPIATLDTSMNYTVIITDLETGCSNSEAVNVRKINECSEDLISMPNAFSPNGDGNNDRYEMYSGTIEEIEYFRVFDRWGSLVFESNDRNFAWDGKFKGKTVGEGVYIYLLSGICKLDGSTIMKMGDITIHK